MPFKQLFLCLFPSFWTPGDVLPVLMNPCSLPQSLPLAEEICRAISDMNADQMLVTQKTLVEQLVKSYPGKMFVSSSFWKWLHHHDMGQVINECAQVKLAMWKITNHQATGRVHKYVWRPYQPVSIPNIDLTMILFTDVNKLGSLGHWEHALSQGSERTGEGLRCQI